MSAGRVFTTDFAVRYDECDAAGWLRPSVYLCYTQEAATRDARDAGWGPHPWVIRRSRLFVHQAVGYAERLAVKTWGRGLGRSTAQRAYEFSDEHGRLVAEAHSLWVYLDETTLRPSRLPADFNEIWFPGREPLAPSDLPDWPANPATAPYSSTASIGYSLLDGQQHLNNARYLDLLDDATWAILSAQGLELEQVSSQGGLLASSYDVEYLNTACLGDELTVNSWLSSTSVNYLDRQQEIRRGEQLVARSHSNWRWVNPLGEARAVPETVLRALAAAPLPLTPTA